MGVDDASGFLGELAVQSYSPQLSVLREDIESLPESLRTVILLIDFDTEVNMEGILGFLENSTGRYLLQTIGAMEAVGARDAAAMLSRIRSILERQGISAAALRNDLNSLGQYQITTFNDSHPDLDRRVTLAIAAEHASSYLPEVGERLLAYVADHLDELRQFALRYGWSLTGK